MATRRANAHVKPTAAVASADSPLSLTKDAGPADIRPAVPARVIYTLLGCTAAMVVLPLATFFVSRNWLFDGNATFAGGAAALAANVVLFAYVVAALREDDDDKGDGKEMERRKDE